MDILIDTHALIWYLEGDNALSTYARQLISSQENKRYTSIASIWEIVIKKSLQKLALKASLAELQDLLVDNDIQLLNIHFHSLAVLEKLPHHHRDPFDRIIIAQSISHQINIVSRDPLFDNYLVDRLW